MVDSPWHNVRFSALLVTFYGPHLKATEISFASSCYLAPSERNLFPQEQQQHEPPEAYGLYRECSSKKKKRILEISDTLQRGPRCRPDAENVWGHSLHDCYAMAFIYVGTQNID